MTQHNSFKAAGGGGKKNRTVLKRFERVDLLRKRGEWKEGGRVVGLKKTKPEEKTGYSTFLKALCFEHWAFSLPSGLLFYTYPTRW